MVVHRYHGDSAYIFCDVCGVELGEFFIPSPSVSQIVFLNSCSHYTWEQVGVFCYEYPDYDICKGVEDMVSDHVFHIEDGGHVYYLVPRTLGWKSEEVHIYTSNRRPL